MSMKCGALEPFSRLVCGNGDDDGRVEVERVVERDGKLHVEVVRTYPQTAGCTAGTSLENHGTKHGRGSMMVSKKHETFDEGEQTDVDVDIDTYMHSARTAHTGTTSLEMKAGANACGANIFSETFDEGEQTYADADIGTYGATTFTYDGTEDQTTNYHDERSSAYISGAWTYGDDSTTLTSKLYKTAVAPVHAFIDNVLFGVEQPQPQDEKQKSLALEAQSANSIAAEIVDQSPSDQPPVSIRRRTLRGMQIAFVSEDDDCNKTETEGENENENENENEDKSAVDEDDGTARTSLNVTQESSNSEDGSDDGVETGIDEVDAMFHELAEPPIDEKISIPTSNKEDEDSVVLVKGETNEEQDEHSTSSASIVLTPDNFVGGANKELLSPKVAVPQAAANKKAAPVVHQGKWLRKVGKPSRFFVRSKKKSSLANF